MSREKQIEEMACEKCLHHLACLTNSEYVPTPCPAYEDKAGYRKQSEGEWIFKRTYYEADECNCSVCGQLMTMAKGVRMNYCPNCGAKMFVRMTHTCPHNIPNLIPTIEEMKGGAE